MTQDQLAGKYSRLRTELAQAYAEPEWSACRAGHIDRLAFELIETERALASNTFTRRLSPAQIHEAAVSH